MFGLGEVINNYKIVEVCSVEEEKNTYLAKCLSSNNDVLLCQSKILKPIDAFCSCLGLVWVEKKSESSSSKQRDDFFMSIMWLSIGVVPFVGKMVTEHIAVLLNDWTYWLSILFMIFWFILGYVDDRHN